MTGVALVAAAFAGYALLAARLDRAWISAPIVFVATGFLLGPSILGLLQLGGESETLLRLTEVTLAILLFADAATVRLSRLREDAALPGRLSIARRARPSVPPKSTAVLDSIPPLLFFVCVEISFIRVREEPFKFQAEAGNHVLVAQRMC